jgi:hypothetical protein
VHEGVQVLKQGLIKRIGTGESTDPWNDQWLPRDGMLRPMAPCRVADPLRRVSEFMDASTASWREERVHQCFLPMDADIILGIPICGRRQEDFWSWHYDRRGRFSVRSAYRMLVATRDRREDWLEERASSSNREEVEKQWTSLWQTKVP